MIEFLHQRLSVMMFMQYAIWGVWAPILAVYLGGLESFREGTGDKIALVYMTMAIASIIAPLIAGQIADRYFSTEKFLALAHFAGGILLIVAGTLRSFEMIFWIMMAHCLFYAPTMALTNSICFHHLPNGEKEFGAIRLWGTIGWIAAGWLLSGWLALSGLIGFASNLGVCLYIGGILSLLMGAYCLTLPSTPPSGKSENPFAFLGAFKLAKEPSFAVLLIVAFLVSTELQFYYVFTPNYFKDSPGQTLSPSQVKEIAGLDDKYAAILMRGLDLDRNRKLSLAEAKDFSARLAELQITASKLGETSAPTSTDDLAKLLDGTAVVNPQRKAADIAASVVTTADEDQDGKVTAEEVRQFLNAFTLLAANAAKLEPAFGTKSVDRGGLGLSDSTVPLVMSIGQIAEIVVLLLLPLSLTRLGVGWTIAIGIAAWAVRYAIFAMSEPVGLVIASQALHGFGFGFFFVASMIYADRIAPKDIRASAQGLIQFVTYGVGLLVSSLIAGRVVDYFEWNWRLVFLVPVGITVFCTLLFLLTFREKKAE